MESFRSPKYVERYEDVAFDLDIPLQANVANGAHQVKTGLRIIADNSGEVAPFDWYNARLMVGFKVNVLADGANLAAEDHNGIVNGSYSLINEIVVKGNGIQFNCQPCNHAVNVKSLLEFDRDYAETTGTNHFFYLDRNTHAEERTADAQKATYNRGFATRKVLLGASQVVNTEIPLNQYSFFESLEDELLPNMKVELNMTIESDDNLIWQAGANCRVIITKMQLFVPRITFSSAGQSHYLSKYLKPHKWVYLREMIEIGPSVTQQTGSFRISSGINRPRHVFAWIINDAKQNVQTANPFMYDTFKIAADNALLSYQLEVGNGNLYPENEYQVSTDKSRVYRDVLKYSHSINDYRGGTLLTRLNHAALFPIIYFDLRNQKQDIKDGTTKLTFRYRFERAAAASYRVYALVLYEQDIEVFQSSGKLMLRS